MSARFSATVTTRAAAFEVGKCVTEKVPCTTYHCEVVRQTVPVQVGRFCVPRTITENVPYQVCRTRVPQVVEKYNVQVCHYVCEQKVSALRTVCHMVCEQHSRQVPVTTSTRCRKSRPAKSTCCVPEAGCVHRRTLRGPLRLEGRAGDLHADGGAVRGEAGSLRGLPDRSGSRWPRAFRRPAPAGAPRDRLPA